MRPKPFGNVGLAGSRPCDGITRRVIKEFPAEKRDARNYHVRYQLECGHIVHRNIRGKQWCYCASCLMAGDG